MLCLQMQERALDLNTGRARGAVSASADGMTPAAKRPKLSLQISSSDTPRARGKSTTGLTLCPPTSSPTIRNTYSNAYDSPVSTAIAAPIAVSAAAAAAATAASICGGTTSTFATTPLSLSASSSPARRTPLFADSSRGDAPYQQPMGVRSILRNSPLPRLRPRSTTTSRTPRLRFPPRKQIRYASPLCEDIRTTRSTVTHLQLLQQDYPVVEETQKESRRGDTPPPRDNTTTADDSGDEAANAERMATPMSGRRQRREWAWTLSPIREPLDATMPGVQEQGETAGKSEREGDCLTRISTSVDAS
ncbi:MAG: hypothetical protein M1825_001149 [Sarcosagium campestre]|nr:MAG: hypothetical protein M1825_001149 [Sarcosagium campestre]